MLIASLIIFQVLFFIGLIVMLRKIMTQNVTLATRHLDELSHDYNKKEQEINSKMQQIEAQSQELIATAQQEAVKAKEQMLKEAEAQKEELLKLAHQQSDQMIQQADKSRQALLGELQERIAREAVVKAAELISYVLPDKFKQDVHAHWLEELIAGGFTQTERLHIPPDTREAEVTSAFQLTEFQRQALSKKMREVFGRELAIKENVDPAICAGIIITVGSLVFDGSLKNKVQEQAKHAQQSGIQ